MWAIYLRTKRTSLEVYTNFGSLHVLLSILLIDYVDKVKLA